MGPNIDELAIDAGRSRAKHETVGYPVILADIGIILRHLRLGGWRRLGIGFHRCRAVRKSAEGKAGEKQFCAHSSSPRVHGNNHLTAYQREQAGSGRAAKHRLTSFRRHPWRQKRLGGTPPFILPSPIWTFRIAT